MIKKKINATFNRLLGNFKKKDSRTRFHDLFMAAAMGVLILVSLISLVNIIFTKYQTWQVNQAIQVASEERDNESQMVNQLKEETQLLKDDDYVTKLARSRYYLSKDGEIIFSIPEDNDSKQAQNSNDSYKAAQDSETQSGG